jgi:HEPN domain-containing protein
MCHLTLEKMLKAHGAELKNTLPPKTHDLVHLLKCAELTLPETHLGLVGRINGASIPTRYPDDIRSSIRSFDLRVARGYLDRTREVVDWLKHHLTLKRSSDDSGTS